MNGCNPGLGRRLGKWRCSPRKCKDPCLISSTHIKARTHASVMKAPWGQRQVDACSSLASWSDQWISSGFSERLSIKTWSRAQSWEITCQPLTSARAHTCAFTHTWKKDCNSPYTVFQLLNCRDRVSPNARPRVQIMHTNLSNLSLVPATTWAVSLHAAFLRKLYTAEWAYSNLRESVWHSLLSYHHLQLHCGLCFPMNDSQGYF